MLQTELSLVMHLHLYKDKCLVCVLQNLDIIFLCK